MQLFILAENVNKASIAEEKTRKLSDTQQMLKSTSTKCLNAKVRNQ